MASQVEPIAIIGMSFKFPGGAESTDAFWKILEEKTCTATDYPKDRFNIDAFWHHDASRRNIIKARKGHFLQSDIRSFDASCFSIPSHEVESMDPQHRGLLESAYHAFESAGLRMEDIKGSKTSVYVGCFTSDFATMQTRDTQSMPKYNALGTAGSMLANRISWFFDLCGESMYLDTACSSSLVALALACQSLLSGQSEMAVVGGSNLIIVPEFSVSLSNMNFLSPSGKCNSFDVKGDGYGRGEGLATLVLKPVSKAVADKNPIRGLIRSVGMNQDGYTSGGITKPSKDMQLKLIQDTYNKANLDMGLTRFFEAHGTGTAAGDPVEARAIGEAFYHHRSKDDPIYVGAVKSNFGHLEGCSGLAGVIKTILALERGTIPPNANFQELNHDIDAEFFHLEFPTECLPWPKSDDIRRASVNSFGFGGSNCNVVLESSEGYLKSLDYKTSYFYPLWCPIETEPSHFLHLPTPENANDAPIAFAQDKSLERNHIEPSQVLFKDRLKPQLLILSASDENGVARQAQSLSQLANEDARPRRTRINATLKDVLFTLNSCHTMLKWKSFSIVESLEDFSKLKETISTPTRDIGIAKPNLGLVFTGQGAQWAKMGYELLEWHVFKDSMLRSQRILENIGCTWNLIDELALSVRDSSVNIPTFSQAMTTAIQIALVDTIDFLKFPYSVVVADVLLELKDFERQDAEKSLATQITISCINSPANTTVSGQVASLDAFIAFLDSKKIFVRKLKVDVGYHSPQMKVVSGEYGEKLGKLRPREVTSRAKMVSSVLVNLVGVETVCSEEYWVRNMVSPVLFSEAVSICCANRNPENTTKHLDRRHLTQIFIDGWIEVGPHAALRGPLREIFESCTRKDLLYASLLLRDKCAMSTVLGTIGQLFCLGFEIDIDKAFRFSETESSMARFVVGLPQYPFDHSTIYWRESTRSKAFQFRQHGNHPLLGCQIADWNDQNTRWRFMISKDEIPWVSDHKVHGAMWYPAAGMIVMAVEAVKQLVANDHLNFEIQNVTFSAPIIVSETTAGTEAQIAMTSTANGGAARETDYEFRIYVKDSGSSWHEVCDGTIIPKKNLHPVLEVNKQDEGEYKSQFAQLEYEKALASCKCPIEASEMYSEAAENCGLQYGPSFQALTRIYCDERGQALAELKKLDQGAEDSSRPFTIHPATLDGVLQLALPALSKGLEEPLPTLVPSRVSRIWIASDDKDSSSMDRGFTSGSHVVHARSKLSSKRSAISHYTVFSKINMDIKIQIEGLELVEAARDEKLWSNEQVVKPTCYELHWKVDPTLLNKKELFAYCLRHRDGGINEPQEWYTTTRLVLLGFATEALEGMKLSKEKPIPRLEKYAIWLQARLNDYWSSIQTMDHESHLRQSLPSGVELQNLALKTESTGHRGAIGVLVGRNLRDILLGKIDPLQTLFADIQYVSEFYEELNTVGKAFSMLNAYLDAWAHKDPSLKFIEIGAGTSATTSIVLDVIAGLEAGPRYAEYMFTDISAFFFPAAQKRFETHDRILYKALDIEIDPSSQGFELETYDVVVAANVLHATKDLKHTLSNVRKLLKPQGKLILMEMTTPDSIETGFAWGSLPGWWQGMEEHRQLSPVVDEHRWDDALKKTGFNGTEQIFSDWDSNVCHGWSIMVSSATPQQEDQGETEKALDRATAIIPNMTIIVDDDKPNLQMRLAQKIMGMEWMSEEAWTESGLFVTFHQLLSQQNFAAKQCILLADLNKAHLQDTSPSIFRLYQKILMQSEYVLWIQTYEQNSESAPYYAMAEGLCRVCRNENPSAKIVTLTLEIIYDQSGLEKMANQIFKVMRATHQLFAPELISQNPELHNHEYMEITGYLCVNRLRQASYLNQHVFNRTVNPLQLQNFAAVPPVMMNITTPGLLDTIEWVEDAGTHAPLTETQVEVRVQAIGVNLKDCLTLLGRVNAEYLGSECAGIINRIGSRVTDFKLGDRVAVAYVNTYRTLVRAEDRFVMKIPDCMSFEDAAGVPTAFCTAYYCLYSAARLKKGESILIHAAAGGTGQAVVQIAQHIDAEIFATVGSASKRDFLVSRYGIREDHIFYSRDASFADGIRRMTNGRGVDVVINSLSGKLLVASWELIADYGRFIEIGRKDIDSRGFLPMFPFIRNATFTGVDLMGIIDGAGQKNLFMLREIFNLMASGVLSPSYPVQPHSIDRAHDAFRLLISGKSTGKVVLTMKQDAIIPVKASVDSDYRFAENATYAIAGGLGGIGRQIARWMVRRGACNILLLVRSGPHGHPKKMGLIQELEGKHVKVHCAVCDITDLGSVRKTIQDVARSMPPIKGCFQAAMIIRDRPFENMTYTEWCQALHPKVQGSWNLHLALPAGMDFFIMLSSAVCIFGNSGQANYSAGNTFQDALARHRVAHGERAVAIDLGLILGEGWVAERKNLQQRVMTLDQVLPLSQSELFALFDYFCNPNTPLPSPASSQIVTGLELPALILRAGRQIPESMTRPLFRAMHQVIPGGETITTAAAAGQVFATIFEEAGTLSLAGEAVAEALKTKLCKIFGLQPSDKSIHDRMESFGVDSLIALEIRNWLAKDVKASLAAHEVLGDVTLIETGLAAANKSELRPQRWGN
ncbi:hypothetical protein QQS21_001304 [Conoideocrella luteorostrata]|uniref:Polyketide synthase n=1 Tax=Conoideocrella luteorostrata TaxID=1105319 RepID=A0AAJ0FXN5_9HYPO|nr:hypothetical protein QQS21_001304 [Conoideocrella luteorostrata]